MLNKKIMNNLKYIWKNKYLYIMIGIALVYFIIFHYLPMYGVVIAFQDFRPSKSMFDQEWVGFDNFIRLFTSKDFVQIFKNTVLISFYKLIFSFPVPIIIALLINEMKNQAAKKVYQTIIYLPHFISWAVIAGIFYRLSTIDGGVLNEIVKMFGGEPIMFTGDKSIFRGLLVVLEIWKEAGWGSIIYIAALSGINVELYEAATVDGANRWQQTIHVTLAGIKSTIFIMFVLAIGNIMNAGFTQIIALYNPNVYEVSDILDTYVFRVGLQGAQYSYATAVGLFKSVIALILILFANKFARIIGEDSLF